MKKRNLRSNFIKKLKKIMHELQHMHKGDVHVFTINANYGRYKLVVGPVNNNKDTPLEIDGEIHHLFVTPDSISPNPPKGQIEKNLKNTIIMKDLMIHIDEKDNNSCGVHPREYINLAGDDAEKIFEDEKELERLSEETYKIVQDDIIKSLEKEEKHA